MGSNPFGQIPDRGTYDSVAYEGPRQPSPLFVDKRQAWSDESVVICVYYGHGKAFVKFMERRMPSWRVKAQAWLNWLRGLVGGR
jgi:hypothetical protein